MTREGSYTLHNIDRGSVALGGQPSDEDHCVVYKDGVTAPHPLTGKPQPSIVFSGRKIDCYAWITEQQGGKLLALHSLL